MIEVAVDEETYQRIKARLGTERDELAREFFPGILAAPWAEGHDYEALAEQSFMAADAFLKVRYAERRK